MEQACSALQAAHQCGIIHRERFDTGTADWARDAPADSPQGDGTRLDSSRADVVADDARRDVASTDTRRPDSLRPDVLKPVDQRPDSPPQVGSYSFDFNAGTLTGWTVTAGTWDASSTHLESKENGGASHIERPIAVERTRGTLQVRIQLSKNDARNASFSLRDANTNVLELQIDNAQHLIWMELSGKAVQQTWVHDGGWHTLVVKFVDGTYDLFYDGQKILTRNGPAQLKATKLHLGGYQASLPGTSYDDVSIGP